MIWDQPLSSWHGAWHLVHRTIQKPCDVHILVGHTLDNWQQMMDFKVGLQFLLTPWLLSTWFGDWLASQFPVWDMVADTWSASHRTCSKLTQTQCIIDNSGVGLLKRQVLIILILQSNIYLGVATFWVVSVNLMFARIVREWHEKSGQPNCTTSWD